SCHENARPGTMARAGAGQGHVCGSPLSLAAVIVATGVVGAAVTALVIRAAALALIVCTAMAALIVGAAVTAVGVVPILALVIAAALVTRMAAVGLGGRLGRQDHLQEDRPGALEGHELAARVEVEQDLVGLRGVSELGLTLRRAVASHAVDLE